MAISTTGIIASGGDEGTIKLWDIGVKAERLFLATGAGAGAEETHGAVLECICTFRAEEDVNAVTFSPFGKWLVTAADCLQLWNVETKEPVKKIECGACDDMEGLPRSASFNADGTRLVIGCDDGTVKLVEMVPR